MRQNEEYEKSVDNFVSAKSPDYGKPLAEFASASGLSNLAIEAGLQELYERIQRLNQKIDRIEAAMGSVPKK
jgi:hypothetical protein